MANNLLGKNKKNTIVVPCKSTYYKFVKKTKRMIVWRHKGDHATMDQKENPLEDNISSAFLNIEG